MKMLTAAEARAVLRIDQKTLVKIIKSGALPALRLGDEHGHIRISTKALAKYAGLTEQSVIEAVTHNGAKASAS